MVAILTPFASSRFVHNRTSTVYETRSNGRLTTESDWMRAMLQPPTTTRSISTTATVNPRRSKPFRVAVDSVALKR